MYPERETFAAPPVVLVTSEARFAEASDRRQETLDAIAAAVRGRFPVAEPITAVGMESTGPDTPPRMVQRQALVMRDAEATEALTLTANSLIYETTAYRRFEDLSSAMALGCQALVGVGVIPALNRVGLRYINEIRVPEAVGDARAWSAWVEPGMVGPLAVVPGGVPVRGLQGAMAFDLGNGGGLNIAFGAVKQGTMINHRFLLRPPFDPGPYFALDLDGFVELGPDPAVVLDAAAVTSMLAAVHEQSGAAFQRAITDRSRTLFRAQPSGWSGTDTLSR